MRFTNKCSWAYKIFVLVVSLYAIACNADTNKYEFTSSQLKNLLIQTPTSLQFGPDGRLYVAQQDGIIKILSIKKNGPNDYVVQRTEVIEKINQMPNYNDNGLLDTTVKGRQVTG